MAGLFGGAPKISPPPPPPTIDDAQLRIDDARRSRRRKGRAATRLVGTEGSVSTAARELTGN